MKKTEEFQEREIKKGRKQDLKAIYIKNIIEQDDSYEGLTAKQIVELLEKEGIIVEYHYVSKIVGLLRDEYGLPIEGGYGTPYFLKRPDNRSTEKTRIKLHFDKFTNRDKVKNKWGEAAVFTNHSDFSYDVEVDAIVDDYLMAFLASFGTRVTIVEPPEAIVAYKTFFYRILSRY